MEVGEAVLGLDRMLAIDERNTLGNLGEARPYACDDRAGTKAQPRAAQLAREPATGKLADRQSDGSASPRR